MSGVKRSRAAILGRQRAAAAAVRLGTELRASRKRRMSQAALARIVGISRQRLGDLENGRGDAAPSEVWFALAEALGRFLRFEFARDPQTELADAGHLQIQELVLRLALSGGWERGAEVPSGGYQSDRSADVRLIDRKRRRLVIGECWNTFGDLGASWRSSDRKLRDAHDHGVAMAGNGEPFDVGLCWIVRDSKANRELVAKYEHLFAARFPGSSEQWVKALTTDAPMPAQPGLIWADTAGTRLFARRRARNR